MAGAGLTGAAGVAQARPPSLSLSGRYQQSGFAIGVTTPRAGVLVDSQPVVTTSADGYFVVGFDRDAPAQAAITVQNGDGTAVHDLPIAPGTYDIQRVDGLPQDTVTPTDPALLLRIAAEAKRKAVGFSSNIDADYFKDGFILPVQATRISGSFGGQRILNGVPSTPHYGYDMAEFTEEMLEMLRNATFVRLSDEARKHVDLAGDEIERLLAITSDVDVETLPRLFAALLETHDQVSRAARPRIVLEMAIARLASTRPVVPVSAPGDVWQLGDHRVICGDSCDVDVWIELLDGELADCVWTDPPYNVAYESKLAGAIKNDSMKDAAFREFLLLAFTALWSSMKPGAAIKGPAIIAEDETSTIVGANFTASINSLGYIILERSR